MELQLKVPKHIVDNCSQELNENCKLSQKSWVSGWISNQVNNQVKLIIIIIILYSLYTFILKCFF